MDRPGRRGGISVALPHAGRTDSTPAPRHAEAAILLNRRKHANRKGFTLIELLIVVVIIGILAAIAIPKFANTKEKAYGAAMKSDLRNLVTAQEAFFRDNQTYAPGMGARRRAITWASCRGANNVIVLSTVTAAGWAGEATNATLKGTITKCGIYVGSGTKPNGAVKNEGAPACY